jgi:hypothetical protein
LVEVREVQEFFGHESPTMTSNYAKILDTTLLKKTREFRELYRDDRAGSPDPGAGRLRSRTVYAWSDDDCTLPANVARETRDNPCSGCAFVSATTQDSLDAQSRRRPRLELIIKSTTDQQTPDLNQPALDDVERILDEAEESAAVK